MLRCSFTCLQPSSSYNPVKDEAGYTVHQFMPHQSEDAAIFSYSMKATKDLGRGLSSCMSFYRRDSVHLINLSA